MKRARQLAPVVLFTYKRPRHTIKVIQALQANFLAKETDLIIYSDGPKTESERDAVQQVRQLLDNLSGFKSIQIVTRDNNLGLANSIITGVTDTVHEFGRVIVLEDDLLTAPNFLNYMNQALERYENDAKVMQISGHMYNIDLSLTTDAFFLPFTTSWGWATWKRSWSIFDPHMSGFDKLCTHNKLRNTFNLDGAYDYFSMLKAQKKGEIDSWAIRWYLSVFLLKGYTLYPVTSFIDNFGFDGSGTHCPNSKMNASLEMSEDVEKIQEFNYPELLINEQALTAIQKYFISRLSPLGKLRIFLNNIGLTN